MSLDVDAITGQMLQAIKGVVNDKWPATQEYFESEAKIFAQRLASIVKMRTDGLISEDRARQHVEFQKNAWDTVLLAINGLNQLTVEAALNAAILVVRDVVNNAIGFVLL